ncbi:hypothetical protein RUM44_003932 [Polyplax serrata]|uniref:Uncharacterized protein n=1 Tax=Polyplax serrata TaxID=468196 RepID=A0ABR1B1G9_POLSC
MDLRIVTQENIADHIKLEVLRNVKKAFEKNLNNLKLEHLLTEIGSIQNQFALITEDNLLLNYGVSIVNYLGRDTSVDSILTEQLESVLIELNKRDENLSEKLITQAWQRLQEVPIFDSKFATKLVTLSKVCFERIVLSFFGNSTVVEYHARMAAESPTIFQTITAILNDVLMRAEGHSGVVELIKSFVGSTMTACQKWNKNFLGLYPNDCTRLVSLLNISPDIYCDADEISVNRNLVLNMVYDMYNTNRRRTLLLLSHYPDWLLPFQTYLKETDVEFMQI